MSDNRRCPVHLWSMTATFHDHEVDCFLGPRRCDEVGLGMKSLECCLERDQSNQRRWINSVRKRVTLAAWAREASLSIGKRNSFQHNSKLEIQEEHSSSNLRPKKIFLIWHCFETLLFASCTFKKLEQIFVLQTRKALCLKLICNLANIRQKKRAEIIQAFSPEFSSRQTSIVFNVLYD